MIHTKKNILFVIGVSGTGKSTIGKMLAEELHLPFFEGDKYHSEANIKKMAGGHPLNDGDRSEWLITLNKLALEHKETGAIIACSALKESYRKLLEGNIEQHVIWISLEGSYGLILERLQNRKGHFMPASLLQSQWDTFEPPKNAMKISIEPSPREIVLQILKQLTQKGARR